MKRLAIYWVIGCVLIGLGAGLHDKRCPNEQKAAAQELFFAIAIWPVGLVWAMSKSGPLPPCTVL